MANKPDPSGANSFLNQLAGRRMLISGVHYINEDNIIQVLQSVLPAHRENIREIKFLEDYEKGIQPILYRKKEVRPEINEHVVVNHAHEIKEFKVGFEFGDPITYVQRDYAHEKSRNDEKERQIERMNEMFFAEGKLSLDQALADQFKICGISFRGALPSVYEDDISQFRLMNLDAKNTFVVYSPDVNHEPVLAGTHYTVQNSNLVESKTYMRCYTRDWVYDLECDAPLLETSLRYMGKSRNGIGIIPIVEYKNDYQRMGCFERVLDEMNALNVVESDRVNGLSQFVQSFIWFDNVDVDDAAFVELKDKGAIATTSRDGLQSHIEYISSPLNQTDAQSLSDNLYDKILRITATPGREQSTGGNTGQAIMLGGSGWQLAEEAATKAEAIFKESDREMLKVVIQILHQVDPSMKGLSAADVEIKFARNKVSNLLTKTQGLQNMLTSGIDPLTAIANSDLFADPQQVYENSKPYLAKWLSNNDTSADLQLGEKGSTNMSSLDPDKADV